MLLIMSGGRVSVIELSWVCDGYDFSGKLPGV